MKRLLSSACSLMLLLQVQGCAMTVYTWKDIPGEEFAHESPVAREAAYRKYAIDKLVVHPFSSHSIGFTTPAEPDRVYDFYSYAPVLSQWVPEAGQAFETAIAWERASYIEQLVMGGVVVADMVWAMSLVGDAAQAPLLPNAETAQNRAEQGLNTFVWANLGVLALAAGFGWFSHYKQWQQYEQLQAAFNSALRQRLQLAEEEASTFGMGSEPTLLFEPEIRGATQ